MALLRSKTITEKTPTRLQLAHARLDKQIKDTEMLVEHEQCTLATITPLNEKWDYHSNQAAKYQARLGTATIVKQLLTTTKEDANYDQTSLLDLLLGSENPEIS